MGNYCTRFTHQEEEQQILETKSQPIQQWDQQYQYQDLSMQGIEYSQSQGNQQLNNISCTEQLKNQAKTSEQELKVAEILLKQQQCEQQFQRDQEILLQEQEKTFKTQQEKTIQLKTELEFFTKQLIENQAKQYNSQLQYHQQIQLQTEANLLIQQNKEMQLKYEEQLRIQDALRKQQQEELMSKQQQQVVKVKKLVELQKQILENTFTESAIILQQKQKISKNKDSKTFIEQQILLEATQSHLFITRTEHFSDKKQLSILKSKLNSQIQVYIEDLKVNNKIEDPSKYQVPLKVNAENPEVLFYVLTDQFNQANKSFFLTKVPSKLNLISLQSIITGDTANSEEYQVTLQETQTNTYDKLENDDNLRKQFEESFIESIALDHKINKENILITRIERGSIQVIYEILDNPNEVRESMDLKELQKRFPGSNPTLKIHKLFQAAALSVDDFDPQYNMEWKKEGVTTRGPKGNTLNYYFPYGWQGYALKVKGIYGENDNWLAMDQNAQEWYALFHGTKFGALPGIMKQRNQGGLVAGQNQTYQHQRCLRTNQVIGTGIYFSNHVEVCVDYATATKLGDKQFNIVFQARVNPQTLKQCQKAGNIQGKVNQAEWNNDYFVVNKSCDIRPYRILLKQS